MYFAGTPIVEVVCESYTVSEGDAVTLECDVTSLFPITEVVWQFTEDGKTETKSHSIYDGYINTVVFEIDEAKPSHQGSYQCSVKNERGVSSASISLAVEISEYV